MTNDEIVEASRLIREIAEIELVTFGKKDDLVLARRHEPSRFSPIYPGSDLKRVSDVPVSLAQEVLVGVIARKKARLNDLRAGC